MFKDKVAIVTGAGKGIGYGIARGLALNGALVVLNDIDAFSIEQAIGALIKENLHVEGIVGDAGDPAFIKEMVEFAASKYNKLDFVVANAGITLFGDFLTYKAEDFYEVLRVNLGGSFFLAQAAAKVMKKQPRGGKILFISSVTGHQAHKDLAAYGMTKAALEMLAKHLVLELSQFKINVNAVAPGATMTERTVSDDKYEKMWSQLTPMGRPAIVEDVVNASLFLLSSTADHITGQTLIIDGGWTSISPGPETV